MTNNHGKSRVGLLQNTDAVLGLPMRLTVSIIIGTIALSAIIAFIMSPCLIPGKLMVSLTPLLHEIPAGHNSTEITVFIKVTSSQGQPIGAAQIRIQGLQNISSNTTDRRGESTCRLTVSLEQGIREGYLDVFVKASCFEPFSHPDMIKVVREL